MMWRCSCCLLCLVMNGSPKARLASSQPIILHERKKAETTTLQYESLCHIQYVISFLFVTQHLVV